jgi:hypothetical protein
MPLFFQFTRLFVGCVLCALQLYAQKMNELKAWSKERNLPVELTLRVKRHYTHYMSHKSVFDESSILSELSSNLRAQAVLESNRVCRAIGEGGSQIGLWLSELGLKLSVFVELPLMPSIALALQDTVENIHFFENADEGFVSAVIMLMKPIFAVPKCVIGQVIKMCCIPWFKQFRMHFGYETTPFPFF